MAGGFLEHSHLLVRRRRERVQIVVARMLGQRVRRDLQRPVVVSGFQKQTRELDLRLGAMRKAFERAAKDVLGVAAEAGKHELGRDVDHGFKTIGLVFQGLQ